MSLHWGGRGPGHTGRKQVILTATATVFWNIADKSAKITISGSPALTATGDGTGWGSVRGNGTKDVSVTGRYYEARLNSGAAGVGTGAGVANATASMATFIGSDTNSAMYFGNTGFYNSTGSPTGATLANGDVLGIAVKNGKIWWSINNVWVSGDPGTAVGGLAIAGVGNTVYPAFSDSAGGQMTARLLPGSLSYSPPTGFVAWDS